MLSWAGSRGENRRRVTQRSQQSKQHKGGFVSEKHNYKETGVRGVWNKYKQTGVLKGHGNYVLICHI